MPKNGFGKQSLQGAPLGPSRSDNHASLKASNHGIESDVSAYSSQRLSRKEKDKVARRIACRITHQKLGLIVGVEESLVLKHINGILEDCGGGPIYWDGFEARDAHSQIFEDTFSTQCPWARPMSYAKAWVMTFRT